MAVTYLDHEGLFTFPAIQNYDQDDADQDSHLDLYILWSARNPSMDITVTNFEEATYSYITDVYPNVVDGVLEQSWILPLGSPYEPSAWIFNDGARALAWIGDNIHRGNDVAFRWEDGAVSLALCLENSCFYPYSPVNGAFISDLHVGSPDIIRHEMGHQIMYRARGNDMWFDLGEEAGLRDWWECIITGHDFFDPSTPLCATTEGWADWFAVLTDGDVADTCFDFDSDVCSGTYVNIETDYRDSSIAVGDTVERWTTGVFLDWEDSVQDGADNADFSEEEVWTETVGKNSIKHVWLGWQYDRVSALAALHQNRIEYDPVEELFIPFVFGT